MSNSSRFSRNHAHSNTCHPADNGKDSNSRLNHQPKFPEQNYDPSINNGNDVTRFRDDVTRVEDVVNRVKNDVTRAADDVTRVRDGVTRVADNVARVGDGVTRVAVNVTCFGDYVNHIRGYVTLVGDTSAS